jgi:hypothetical protein
MASPEKVRELNEGIIALSTSLTNAATRARSSEVRNKLIRMQGELVRATGEMGAGATSWDDIPEPLIQSAIDSLQLAVAAARKANDMPSARVAGSAVRKALDAMRALA